MDESTTDDCVSVLEPDVQAPVSWSPDCSRYEHGITFTISSFKDPHLFGKRVLDGGRILTGGRTYFGEKV